MTVRRPSGTPAPTVCEVGGERVDLVALADEICHRYERAYPDERERYGEAGGEWCRHDNQWLLLWAIDDVLGATSLDEQVRWLARVLDARDFPVARLVHDLRMASDVVSEAALGERGPAVAARLASAAELLAAEHSKNA